MSSPETKRQVIIIRHAEKDSAGVLTEKGEADAKNLETNLPALHTIVSSESSRTQKTAELATGRTPKIDPRAGFYMASQEKSDELNRIAEIKNIPFLEAVILFNDEEVLAGIDNKAEELNNLINQLLVEMPSGNVAIIVSHDLSISPAMQKRGIPLESIPFLHGYIIDEDGEISKFTP